MKTKQDIQRPEIPDLKQAQKIKGFKYLSLLTYIQILTFTVASKICIQKHV